MVPVKEEFITSEFAFIEHGMGLDGQHNPLRWSADNNGDRRQFSDAISHIDHVGQSAFLLKVRGQYILNALFQIPINDRVIFHYEHSGLLLRQLFCFIYYTIIPNIR